MANVERENTLGFVDKRATQGQTTGPGNTNVDGRYLSVGNLRTALAATGNAAYSSANLDKMTKNDMVYALRLANDAGGIK